MGLITFYLYSLPFCGVVWLVVGLVASKYESRTLLGFAVWWAFLTAFSVAPILGAIYHGIRDWIHARQSPPKA